MKEGKAESNNKGLIILLCALVVVIVGLGIGIGVVMLRRSEEEVVVVEDDQSGEVEIVETDPEAAAATMAFVDKQNAIEAEAKELLNQNPPDIEGIRRLYEAPYTEFVVNNEISYAYSYLLSESNLYYENGYKEAALDLLTSVDLTVYDNTLQWIFCDVIVRMADELGRLEIASDYSARAAFLEENTDVILAPDAVHYSEKIKEGV